MRQKRSTARLAASVGVAVTLVLTASCSAPLLPKRPNLGDLYNRAAQDHGVERNPVIVIPGLTGSRLFDSASGRVVWGAFAGDYAKPDRPADARLIALPMREGVRLAELQDDVVSDGVLDRLKVKLLGIPINLQAYYEILTTLGAGGYRDESLALAGEVDWGDEHFTCFQFDYDWRRDNVENAQRLDRFIREKRAFVQEQLKARFGVEAAEVKFDVVAHSMGGLLLRYYLRYGAADLPADGSPPELTWAGAENVEQAVLIAPPNAGAVESLEQLVNGKDYGPFVARYPAVLLGTFPSGYQMLPRGRHEPLQVDGEPVADLFDPRLWQRLRWGLASPKADRVLAWLLPEIDDPQARRRIALDHQRKALLQARRFTAALDRPATPPTGLRYYLIAGDAIDTPRTVDVDSETGTMVVTAMAAGDSKVLRSSALMDERLDGRWTPTLRSPVRWDTVMFLFTDHLGLTQDPVFTDNMLHWLIEQPL